MFLHVNDCFLKVFIKQIPEVLICWPWISWGGRWAFMVYGNLMVGCAGMFSQV